MKDTDLIKAYINREDFEILAPELLDKDYNVFCNIILKNGFIKYSNFLSSAKDALTLKKFFLDIESSNLKNKDYLSVLEIVLFISLIEGYSADRKYQQMDLYLRKNYVEGMTKKQFLALTSKYHEENSLSAKVRSFMAQAPFLDQLYLTSCFEEDKDIKGEKSSLDLLVTIVKNNFLNQAKIQYKQSNHKIRILKLLEEFLEGKSQKTSLSELSAHFQKLNLDDELQSSIKLIANQLYDIRSRFMHTDQKRKQYSFFLDLKKGNIFDFNDIDLFRYFLRTILFINDFKLNVISISSRKFL